MEWDRFYSPFYKLFVYKKNINATFHYYSDNSNILIIIDINIKYHVKIKNSIQKRLTKNFKRSFKLLNAPQKYQSLWKYTKYCQHFSL